MDPAAPAVRKRTMINTALLVLGYLAVFLPALGGLLWAITSVTD
jgi:hypothetical protein